MVLRMKNVNILGVHWRIRLLGGGSRKTHIEGRIAWKLKRGGTWTVCQFKGGTWQERGGSVFEGGGVDTPMHTMCI